MVSLPSGWSTWCLFRKVISSPGRSMHCIVLSKTFRNSITKLLKTPRCWVRDSHVLGERSTTARAIQFGCGGRDSPENLLGLSLNVRASSLLQVEAHLKNPSNHLDEGEPWCSACKFGCSWRSQRDGSLLWYKAITAFLKKNLDLEEHHTHVCWKQKTIHAWRPSGSASLGVGCTPWRPSGSAAFAWQALHCHCWQNSFWQEHFRRLRNTCKTKTLRYLSRNGFVKPVKVLGDFLHVQNILGFSTSRTSAPIIPWSFSPGVHQPTPPLANLPPPVFCHLYWTLVNIMKINFKISIRHITKHIKWVREFQSIILQIGGASYSSKHAVDFPMRETWDLTVYLLQAKHVLTTFGLWMYSCSLFEQFCPPKFPFLLWLKLLVCCTIESDRPADRWMKIM